MSMMCERQEAGGSPARLDVVKGLPLGLALLGLSLSWPEPAFAYVGPGAGITMLGALWAVIAAILFALVGLLWWPVRAMRRRRKRAAATAAATSGSDRNRSDDVTGRTTEQRI
jgi:uncharacterized membrane protein